MTKSAKLKTLVRDVTPHLKALVLSRHPVGWSGFTDWVADFLGAPGRADVRQKLRESGAEERHAFIAASFTSPNDAFFGLTEERSDLPTATAAAATRGDASVGHDDALRHALLGMVPGSLLVLAGAALGDRLDAVMSCRIR